MKKRDIYLVLVFLAAAGMFYLLWGQNTAGNQVRITLDGEEYGTYSLAEDTEIPVKSKNGYNVVAISDGMVYMKDADCPDKYCIHQGKTNHKNKSIVCLPHKLIVEVIEHASSADTDGIDAMAQ